MGLELECLGSNLDFSLNHSITKYLNVLGAQFFHVYNWNNSTCLKQLEGLNEVLYVICVEEQREAEDDTRK